MSAEPPNTIFVRNRRVAVLLAGGAVNADSEALRRHLEKNPAVAARGSEGAMSSTRENAPDAGARRRFGFALALLMVALGLFLLVFGLAKFIIPDTFVAIYQHLYGVSASPALVYAWGALEVLLAIAIIVGAFRRWSYAIGFLAHGTTTVATARLIIDPWGLISGEPQQLYLAAVPVLAAFAALYLLRDLDCFSFDEWRAASRQHAPQTT